MRILFVTNVLDFYITREPLGLAYLAGAAKKAGHKVRFSGINPEDCTRAISEFKPHVVGYSITTGQHQLFFKLNRQLKKRFDFISVFGGPHATFWPEIIHEPGVDAICRGEGETAFIDFVEKLEKDDGYETALNWWVKKDGRVFKNELRPLAADLDDIPWPDRETIFNQFPDAKATPVKCFVPNRGCPYACSYCFNEPYWKLYEGKGKRVRTRTGEAICQEIEHIRTISPLRMPMFTADIFAFSKSWLAEFADAYNKQVRMPYYCNVRANLVDQQYAKLLSESGCVCAAMGIEAGNDRIRNDLFCRGQSRQQIINASLSLKKHGITVVSYNILGVPGTDMQTDMQTLDLNRECKVDYAGTFTLVPLPGTKIHDWIVEQGLIDPVSIDEHFSYYGLSPLPIKQRKERSRLYYLFALAVAFNPIQKMLPLLLKLPLSPVYRFSFRLFRGIRYKRRAFPIPHGFIWTLRAAWRYLMYEHR